MCMLYICVHVLTICTIYVIHPCIKYVCTCECIYQCVVCACVCVLECLCLHVHIPLRERIWQVLWRIVAPKEKGKKKKKEKILTACSWLIGKSIVQFSQDSPGFSTESPTSWVRPWVQVNLTGWSPGLSTNSWSVMFPCWTWKNITEYQRHVRLLCDHDRTKQGYYAPNTEHTSAFLRTCHNHPTQFQTVPS